MRNKLFILLVFSVFLVPSTHIGGLPVSAEDVLILLLLSMSGFKALGVLRFRDVHNMFLILNLFVFFTLISLVLSAIYGEYADIRDIFTSINFFRSTIILLIGVSLGIYQGWALSQKAFSIISVIASIAAVITVIQLFNPVGVGKILTTFYTKGDKYLDQFVQAGSLMRGVGTTGNPNTTSIVLVIGLISNYSSNLFRKYKVFFGLLLVAGILATQSRTGFAMAIASSLFFLVGNRNLVKNLRKVVFTSIVIVFGFVFYGANNQNSFIGRLTYRFTNRDFSLDSRIDRIWVKKIHLIEQSPFFGIGMNKGAESGFNTFDNTFLYVAVSFGLIGLVLFLISWVYPYLLLNKIYRGTGKRAAVNALFATAFLSFITTEWIKSPKMSVLFFLLIGMMYGFVKSSKNKRIEYKVEEN